MASALLLAVVVGVLAVLVPTCWSSTDSPDGEFSEVGARLVPRRARRRRDGERAPASAASGAADDDDEAEHQGDGPRPAPAVGHVAPPDRTEEDDVHGYRTRTSTPAAARAGRLAARVSSVRLPAPAPASADVADRPSARRAARVRRRRLVLGVLLGAAALLALVGLALPLLRWPAGLLLLAGVGYVAHLRREVERERRWRERSGRGRGDGDASRPSAYPEPPAVGTQEWQPVPVPEPTYVRLAREAERQEITSRTLLSWRVQEIDEALDAGEPDPVERTLAEFRRAAAAREDARSYRRRAVGE